MIRNRSRRLSSYVDRRLYSNGIEILENNDVIAVAGYIFNVSRESSNEYFFENREPFDLLKKLADKLELTDRLKQVIQTIKDIYVSEGRFHLNTSKEDVVEKKYDRYEYRYSRENLKDRASAFEYEEDFTVDRRINFLKSPEYARNFYRIMNFEDKGIFSQIVYYTFFTKANVNLKEFHENIPCRFEKKIHDTSKLNFLKKELNLSEAESDYLLFRYRKITIEGLSEVLGNITDNSVELYTKALDISKKQFNEIVRRDSKLREYGFIDQDRNINTAIIECIEAQNLGLYFDDCVKELNLDEVYGLETFAVPEKNTDIYKGLLKSDNAVQLLLYGAPGAGKTEYAKALVKSTGKKALIFKNESELYKQNEVLGRLNCLLTLNRKDTVLIIDEADTLLATSMKNFFGIVISTGQKGVVNKMLEMSQNKVIWIVNYKSRIDESTLRRFTVSYKFDPMSPTMLESIAERKLETLEIGGETKKEILKLLSQYKVTGASIDNLVKTINSMNKKNSRDLIENIGIVLKENSSLLHGEPKMRTHVKDSYDMSVLNTSISSKKIMDMLYNAKKYADKNPGTGAVRMLFYGLSGTGKTEFARYISESLGKEILLKRASDIFDKYVGGTEQNIAAAFAEAARKDQILLFDEADSFFSDRNNAERNFERTQVNEFLTQLEEFPGIVICTTNLRNIMDPAMLRRFHITVDFRALTEEGIKKLLYKFFKEYEFSDVMIKKLAGYKTVTPGDFGRLADTVKFMNFEELNAEYIVDQLCSIQKEKDGSSENKRGIGFCA